jgi:glutathione synthase/RimK-type ligase-like ATP-grasp enzyme
MSAGKQKGRVAVITGVEDAHIPFVERHLSAPLIVLDMRELAGGVELSYRLVGDRIIPSYRGESLGDVSGVWYRKPQPIPQQKLPVEEAFRPYSADAMERHSMLLRTAFEHATWASDYYAMARANQKSLQLAVARRLGFRVPDTVITSSPDVARAFIEEHRPCVSKSLTPTYPELKGKQQILLTTLITKDSPLPDLSNLYLAPSIFQEAVDTKYDLRVTVVGDKVFPAIMTSGIERTGNHQSVRDNRLGDMQLVVADKFPKAIAEKCIAHVRELGLNFGAIDLLVDTKGEYWFLENNPNGQWAFVEEATGLPIGKTLAELLEGGLR